MQPNINPNAATVFLDIHAGQSDPVISPLDSPLVRIAQRRGLKTMRQSPAIDARSLGLGGNPQREDADLQSYRDIHPSD